MRKISVYFVLLLLVNLTVVTSQDNVKAIRVLWFDDGKESVIMQTLIDEFEQEHPDVEVELDIIAYANIHDIIRNQIEMGDPPDIARHTNLGQYRDAYLDLRPYLTNATEWDENFPPPFLAALRDNPTDNGLHGYPSDVTVSAPFINRTMWERAGVRVPSDVSDSVTWDDWVSAAAEVQNILRDQGEMVYAVAMDRSGHRFWGPSLSQCATYLQPDGTVKIDSEGFRKTAQMLLDWHVNSITPLDVWAGIGDNYTSADVYFEVGELAFYFSGSWQVGGFALDVGDAFEWEAVPNPVGECGQSGMIGGGVVSAFAGTAYPEEVGQLMSYLTQKENMARYYAFNQMLPGYLALAEEGLPYEQNAEALNLLGRQLGQVLPEAYELQYHPESGSIHAAIRRGLIEMVVEELPIDDVVEDIQNEVDSILGD